MHISKVTVSNFRLLKNTTLDLRDKISLLLGRNNCGKTSLLVIFERFFGQNNFNYNDFSIYLRKKIKEIKEDTDISPLSIRMTLQINYDENDNLENLSEFILDLDPDIKNVKILFEARIDKKSLLKKLADIKEEDREKFIVKNIDHYLSKEVYVFSDETELLEENRHKLIKKEISTIRNLINLQIIHAKRNVSSSEENSNSKRTLSNLTTEYFNSENDTNNSELNAINEELITIDNSLDDNYKRMFSGFLDNSKKFLELEELKVISNIQSKELLAHSSQVIYGSSDENRLPEHLNGLGFMNILFLLLTIEMKKTNFKKENKDINLLFIEEPEAHTHPQMQYIFANKIQALLGEISSLQTVITTHSSHIVSQSNFEDIRYLLKVKADENIEIKNFHTELKAKYTDQEQFKFLEHYLNIQSAELFFASKVIFIEGITERMLLPYFIDKFDESKKGNPNYIPITSQCISILEVGANAKAFKPFLEFLNIKTLVFTDFDTTKKNGSYYSKEPVTTATHTSNATLTHFFSAPESASANYSKWFKKLEAHTLSYSNSDIKIMYQQKENSYHARSFEDAFINVNLEKIKLHKDKLWGLKNIGQITTNTDIYTLTEEILDKKSDFASSLLYLALSQDSVDWVAPQYIKEGLEWIVADDSI